jgi:hypothetical protein
MHALYKEVIKITDEEKEDINKHLQTKKQLAAKYLP